MVVLEKKTMKSTEQLKEGNEHLWNICTLIHFVNETYLNIDPTDAFPLASRPEE